MDRASRVRVAGPLAPYASEFRDQLLRLDYRPASASAHLALMSQLNRWLELRKLAPEALTAAVICLLPRRQPCQGAPVPEVGARRRVADQLPAQ